LKTDTEIKDWIDEREVLTQNELSRFMWGYVGSYSLTKNGKVHQTKLGAWWDYVLNSKNLEKLKQYKQNKIYANKQNFHKQKDKICEILKTDERFVCPAEKAIPLFKKIYKINVSEHAINKYKKEIGISLFGSGANPRPDKQRIIKLMQTDKRLTGYRRGLRLLEKLYKIKISSTAYKKYKREILNQTITKC